MWQRRVFSLGDDSYYYYYYDYFYHSQYYYYYYNSYYSCTLGCEPGVSHQAWEVRGGLSWNLKSKAGHRRKILTQSRCVRGHFMTQQAPPKPELLFQGVDWYCKLIRCRASRRVSARLPQYYYCCCDAFVYIYSCCDEDELDDDSCCSWRLVLGTHFSCWYCCCRFCCPCYVCTRDVSVLPYAFPLVGICSGHSMFSLM